MFKRLLEINMDEKIKKFHTNKCGEQGIHF